MKTTKLTILAVLAFAALVLGPLGAAYAQPANNTGNLQKEIQLLKERINQLERQLAGSSGATATTLTKEGDWSPFEEMQQVQKEMNRMFNNSFWHGAGTLDPTRWQQSIVLDPQLDIKQLPKEYLFQIDLPGMDKSNIKVQAENKTLMVSGEKKSDTEENAPNKYYRRERSFGSFSRAIPLPEDAMAEGIQAEYKNGVLMIHIPRAAMINQPQQKNTVEIK
jgi:HSP20 family protein